ncbi:MAG TPA: polysaccharide pyruvyl transferase family protein [Roseiarcus sp.]|nr:polysaccharide pyruvyl transferase family protein [Roseiarcus sp.]
MTKRSGPDEMPESPRIAFYGNFGVGNLGNEATLQAIIERTQRRWPDARMLCFCTDPEDVRARHHIAALRAQAVDRGAAETSGAAKRRGGLTRIFRIAFKRIPLELMHWVKCFGALSRTDMLIVAGTGIVCDYTTGPMGYPYDIFKLSTLAALCRVKLAFLSVGVGPIHHPLSRLMLKWSLSLASHRSYRDEASKQYLEGIGFGTKRDCVCPDAVFGLATGAVASGVSSVGRRRIVGLGIKDYGSAAPAEARAYLDTMADFVAWLQGHGYGVRLLIGDIRYDTAAIEQFVGVLKNRGIPTAAPLLIVEPAPTVEELLRQISETEAVISARYHNLVLALIQGKPVIALSDHGKLNSVVTEFGLGRYLLPLKNLTADVLIDRFKQLETDVEGLRPRLKAKLETYRRALDGLYATFLGEPNVTAREHRALDSLVESPAAPLIQKE